MLPYASLGYGRVSAAVRSLHLNRSRDTGGLSSLGLGNFCRDVRTGRIIWIIVVLEYRALHKGMLRTKFSCSKAPTCGLCDFYLPSD